MIWGDLHGMGGWGIRGVRFREEPLLRKQELEATQLN